MPQQPGLHNSLVVKVMEEEEDDDIYAAEEEKTLKSSAPVENDVRLSNAKVGEEEANEDEEEGEEVEEEDSDSVRTSARHGFKISCFGIELTCHRILTLLQSARALQTSKLNQRMPLNQSVRSISTH